MPIDDLTALGQKMREARKNKELTQQELSDLSHVSVKKIGIILLLNQNDKVFLKSNRNDTILLR